MFFSLLTIIVTFVKAQGNLQFNRVVYLNISGTQFLNLYSKLVFIDTVISVPTNKVWKIESANVTTQSRDGIQSSTIYQIYQSNEFLGGTHLLLNNVIISSNDNKPTVNNTKFPIWLPSGTYPLRLLGQFGSASGTYLTGAAAISILEFNIIQ